MPAGDDLCDKLHSKLQFFRSPQPRHQASRQARRCKCQRKETMKIEDEVCLATSAGSGLGAAVAGMLVADGGKAVYSTSTKMQMP